MKTPSLLWLLVSLLCICIATDTDSQKKCWDKKYTSNSCHKMFCEPWQRCVDGRCICKLAYQCPRNIGISVCAETDKTFKNYCHLKTTECSNPIYRAVSDSPCRGKIKLSLTKKNGNSTSNNGLLKIKLPVQEEESYVCSEKWTIKEANVACRQLDNLKGASVLPLQFPINKRDQKQTECLHITCRGTETSLAECTLKKGRSNEETRAGVNCYKEKRNCTSDEFTCVNEKCIPLVKICDGENDCGDLSDELCCSECKKGFHCKSDVCIPEHYVCNGERDCLTEEDEVGCKDTNVTNVATENKDEHLEKPKGSENAENAEVNVVNFDLPAERKLIMDHLTQINCGVPKKTTEHKRAKRIIGGQKATANQFPWQVAIKEGSKVNCGGIYIGGCWVLTAAHCVRPNQPQKYHITIEMLDRLSVSESVDTFPVKSVKVHDNYVPATYENDIALLEVENIYKRPSCMEGDNNLVRACVPWSPYQFKAGDTCVVSGWGREEGFSKVFHLKWGNINLMNNCSEVYKNRFFENMECAGTYDGSIDACKGDSGGPLVCYDANNVAYVWGIVSWGENCGVAGFPGVYTKVANYFEWISRQIGRDGRALIAKYNV